MKVALNVSPLSKDLHKVRGSGFYVENLKNELERLKTNDQFLFFNKVDQVPLDIDLVHYPFFEPFFLTLPLKNKCKTIVTVHDLTPIVLSKLFPVGIKGRIKWEIQKRKLQKSFVVTDSESSKKDILKLVGIPEKNIHVVYLAAGEEFKQIEDVFRLKKVREKYNLPEKFVLYVGDVTPNKNLPRLADAVTKLGIVLVMVGKALVNNDFNKNNGWNKDLKYMEEKSLANKKIIRLGFVPAEDLVVIYNLATVFAMPSLYEGFGLPILEAMKCGCPVVTTKEGSIPEIAGEAVLYVDAYNADDIARGIRMVYSDNKIQKELSDKGLIQADKFSWKKTALDTINVYKNIRNK